MKRWNIIVFSLLFIFVGVGCNSKTADKGSSTDSTMAAKSEIALSGKIVDGVREINLNASQFKFEPDTIVVKKGEKVRIKATSSDVMHGIDIHALGIERKLPPHQGEIIEFTPQKVGDFHFHCSVYCGAGHGKMHGTLKVLE